jgi:hypothetical protein
VPAVDTSRYPCIPLPMSTAQPYGKNGFVDVPPEEQRWEYVEGQKLEGKMIPTIKRPVEMELEQPRNEA